MKQNDPTEAYLWLAQINQGQKLETVRQWAEQAVKEQMPVPVFEEQKKIVDLFKSKGVKVYIITASITWAVEPGAKMIGLEFPSVLGVETKVENDFITENPKGVITYQMGKVRGFARENRRQKTFLCLGQYDGGTSSY